MNARFSNAMLLAFILFATACQRPLVVDDEPDTGGADWELLGFKPETYIQGLHATEFELYAITEKSFARLNSNLDIIEQRSMPISNSIPVMGDNSFVRLTTNDQNRQVIEFRLTRNGDETFRVLADTLPVPAGNTIEIETDVSSPLGEFSYDGTIFMLAAKVLPARHFSLYMFEVRQNFAHDAFVSVNMFKRIDLTDLEANTVGVVKSIKFLNGNFYVATQQGAWRVTPAGNAAKLPFQWKEDCFTWQGDLFMTGLANYDLDKSIDNGLAWERMNINSELRHVTVADTIIFTQEIVGKAFSVMPKDFKKAKSIVYPVNTNISDPVFYGLVYFNDRYYFSINKEIYATSKVVVE